ncbi:hypothetical protein QQS21_000150 [Conoideocrella luteorostrata]|uniref:alpha-1,2-Mannosidase n=1 Tax=Conoideocrella luteorostrata TaxID=1105319 RepID=A0AAJ0CZP6_9HYPO|nr:hypothetical protein QQS21_000150 [Conoideocrella luteorostrata]
MRADRLAQLRQDTVDMFYHGFSNYMKHAFPEDELRPLTCGPLTRDRNDPTRIELNDALGNYSLTLIDSLSTLAILAGGPQDGSYTGPRALSDFHDGVAQFVHHYGDGRHGPSGMGARARGFDLDSKVQVFETVIRGLGGLLSAHLFAVGELPITGYYPRPLEGFRSDDPLEHAPIAWPNGLKYDGQLLRLALDLAERLLPAFYTKTGIPYPRVNLRTGIPFYVNSPLNGGSEEGKEEDVDGNENHGQDVRVEITETCSAGAGSLILEFTVLSRLTGDPRFENAAKRAFWEVWRRRSEIGLIGNGIDAERGSWIGPHSGIGAGMDSFFEYAFKSHVLLSGQETPNATKWTRSRKTSTTSWLDPNSLHDPLPREMHSSDSFLRAWHEAHASVKRHIYTDKSHFPYYSNSHRATGQPYTMWIDSLGAFYPGLLALAGEVEEAIEANLVYTALWTRYSALPERWSIRENNVEPGIGWWPGRPEFIESTYYIYRATKDPWYLHVGEMVLRDIRRRCYAPCGWAGLQDVRTGEKQNRMESFFLGETTKYMYLLFDPDHPLNNLDAAYVFTTEGHPLVIPKKHAATEAAETRGGKHQASHHHQQQETGVVSVPSHGENFTNTCPAPPPLEEPLTGSSTAARRDLFGVSRFTNLYNTPNIHGPMQEVLVHDDRKGQVTKYRAVSNHTIFPWTLPPTMLPPNGTCTAPPQRIISAIEFPATDAASSLMSRFGVSLAWYSYLGPTITNLEGLRLQLEREFSDRYAEHVWKITHVGSTQLGRHETVFFHGEHVRQLRDDAFTALRRKDVVDIQLLVDTSVAANSSSYSSSFSPNPEHADNPDNLDNANVNANPSSRPRHSGSSSSSSSSSSTTTTTTTTTDQEESQSLHVLPSESLFKNFLRAVTSVFDPSETSPPESEQASPPPTSFYTFQAFISLGPGAHPVPAVLDTPIPDGPSFNALDPVSNFPWTTIHLADQACEEPLPDHVPKQHQVIVLRRGGCSFSEKVNNIPAFIPHRDALQLVIVVDELDEQGRHADELPRPLLESEQLTPKGLKRLHGVPLVLMRVGRGEYDLFGRALAVGMRRKYTIQSQGLIIENAVVL